ncbi:hypothetical protein RI129_002023 [Pyrocoelia pectoralis]|uniref:BCL-6 corepressor n=1 Tax=Pyrocoelia pectoralis TaxID=417401 RepID=A0AAN7VW04_9COLE
MDVSFTNVLEGARQYFQGLPTTTCSTSNPAYPTGGGEHQTAHYNTEPNSERTPTSSYWPPQERSQSRDLQQRPSSHQSEPARPSSHNQGQIQEQIRSSSSYHAPNSHQEQSIPTSHTYQFARPHSREIQQSPHHLPQHQQQQHQQQQPPQQQYQSHILPNPAYQQSTASIAHRTPSRVPEMTAPQSQTYHQMQQSQNHAQQQPQAYSGYQQNRTYYPVHTQPQQTQYYNHSYQVASSQGYSQTQSQEVSYAHSYPSHPQNSYPNENTYMTSKVTPSHNPESGNLKEQSNMPLTQNQQAPQPYRATHNLPPIAALSSLNYHSSRSREAIRIANNKSRVPAPSTSTPSYSTKMNDTKHPVQQQYSSQNTHTDYASQHHNRTTVSQSYQCPPAVTYSNNQFTSSTPASMTTAPGVHAQSSYALQESPKTYHIPNSKIIQSHPNTTSVTKQKRESPLDLSVKTVRTSADSTLDDTENDQKRLAKYYQTGRPSMHSPMQAPTNYPVDTYNNTYQRGHANKSTPLPSSGVPKVDFLPNFNVSALSQGPTAAKVDNRRLPGQATCDNVNQRQYYDRKTYHQAVLPQPSSNAPRHSMPHTSPHYSSTGMLQNTPKKPVHGLPRIDFLPPSGKTSAMYAVPSGEAQRKRPSEPIPSSVPNKIQKVDVWRQTIDQQIEQRLSSYAKSRLQQEQVQKPIQANKPIVNGNFPTSNQDRSKESYTSYHRPSFNTGQPSLSYANNSGQYMQSSHNQTYVPTPVAHQYPAYTNHGSQQQQTLYVQNSLPRTNSNPSLPITNTNRNNLGGAADRRVLSLLRNSLEIKGAKEAQKKLEREQHKPLEHSLHHPRTDVQQPSTDVMAPLQPKPGVVGRHNMSPFAATSIFDQNSNTPPTYKFHLPKAIDSIKFDTDIPKDNRVMNKNLDSNMASLANSNTDLDGLTAILAARIRTKAELKQVGNHYSTATTDNNIIRPLNDNHLLKQSNELSNGSSPPKLTREKSSHLPRRKLFNRCEDELNGSATNNVPHRDKSGLRSSSETSVFDFPDSDSDTEMPVLERQSLLEMRRDRKVPKPNTGEGGEPSVSLDVSFNDACDKFMAQLKTGIGKKRGRRKKIVEADVLAKLETVVTREKPRDKIKDEPKDEASDSDSDVPLINCKSQPTTLVSTVSNEEEISHIKNEENTTSKLEMSFDSGSDTENETVKNLPDNLKEQDNVNREKDISKPSKEKSGFGDGTDFHPGWEEEVYKYKRSLRMPAALIHVTRPPQWHRLSTSLPDLDPCPNSPSPSENPDSLKSRIKIEPIDSDLDSNSNFSFSFVKSNYDSEEGSSSAKSVPTSASSKPKNTNSILDRLMERCGARKRKRLKKKSDENLKIIEKSEKELELLPTPGLEVETINSKKIGPIVKEETALLGFRKKTIDNFKDTFINNSKNLLGVNKEFKAVIKSSRTRLESRVLKQKATIKEVFGEDRPASAPPVTCVDNTEEVENKSQLNISFSNEHCNASSIEDLKVSSVLENTREVLKSKLLNRGRKGCVNLLKSLTTKKIISEFVDDDNLIKQERDSKSETPSIDGDDYTTPARRKMKNIRRKFSSGFDYIRKKKKQVKKENAEAETTPKSKRRGALPKATPESEQDIQREIKMWVMNKGIGETHLHRAARLGYTDITAYCLEKMDSFASPKDNAGYTPLHEACARGHLSIAKLLLLYGANVSESAQGGIRPLHEAAENGFAEIVRLLLSYGADPTLATYSGLKPLSLATEEITVNLLQNHIADVAGEVPSSPWNFRGPATFFDLAEMGYDPLEDVPPVDPVSEDEDIEFEISDQPLPNLYSIRGEAPMDRWILLQDLSNILRIKSRDALLKQICPIVPSSSVNNNYKSVLRELKMSEFLEQARCCQYMCVGEKINTRASKIALVKYSDKVKELLAVDKIMITVR